MIDILINTLFTAVVVMGIFGGLVLGTEMVINRFPKAKNFLENMFGEE